MVAHTFNPSFQDAEADKSLNLKQSWSTEGVSQQQELNEDPL